MSYADSHRWASENIIAAAKESDPERALEAFKLGAVAVGEADNPAEVVLSLGLARTAIDMYLTLRLTHG